MNILEHLAKARDLLDDPDMRGSRAALILAEAQVHATVALAMSNAELLFLARKPAKTVKKAAAKKAVT